MKKRTIIISAISLVLSACSISFNISLTELKTGTLYSFIDAKNSSEVNTLDSYDSQEFNYYYVQGEEGVPYVTLSTYSSLIENYLLSGFKSSAYNSGRYLYWLIANSTNQTVFYSQIDYSNKMIACYGDVSNFLTVREDYSNSTLSLRVDEEVTLSKIYNKKKYSYKNTTYKSFTSNGNRYFPLSLLESTFSSMTGLHILWNYKNFYQFKNYEDITTPHFISENKTVTVFEEMNDVIENSFNNIMPEALLKDRSNAFIYIMENLYGIKETKGISSMKDYLNQNGLIDQFLNADNNKRREAYAKIFGLLDDGHCAARDDASYPWLVGDYNFVGPKISTMIETKRELQVARNNSLPVGDIYYSTDEKLAFFSFDDFTFARNAYDDEEQLKESLSDYHSVDYDTYFYFVKNLQQIKAKTGVDDVIIDCSINGGGTVGVMTKLLALLSKDNSASIYIDAKNYGIIEKETFKIDSDGNGEYNVLDSFGQDFNFYILVSPYSYSCGNAFPLFARKNGIASTIGINSSGGECSVGEAYLPSGEHFYHSSNLHIGWYDEKEKRFLGSESGCGIDYPAALNDFYNLDKLQTIIHQ